MQNKFVHKLVKQEEEITVTGGEVARFIADHFDNVKPWQFYAEKLKEEIAAGKRVRFDRFKAMALEAKRAETAATFQEENGPVKVYCCLHCYTYYEAYQYAKHKCPECGYKNPRVRRPDTEADTTGGNQG